jgi:uridine kinase
MENVSSAPIVIFEGILSLYDIRIRNLMDIKIFVLTDDDVRLARRCKLNKPLIVIYNTFYSVERLFRAWQNY